MSNTFRTILFSIAGILTIAGVILHFSLFVYAPYVFAVGVAGIAVHYLTISPKNMPLRQRGLHNLEILASLAMIVSSGLMFSNRKEWIICLFIAALILLYSAFVPGPKKDDTHSEI